MEQLRKLEHVARALIAFKDHYPKLLRQFADAHARLREICGQPGRGQQIGIEVGDLAGNEFGITYCDLRLRVRFIAEMTEPTGAARGRVDFLEVIPHPINPERPVESVTFTRTGETPVRDADIGAAYLEDNMVDFVFQVIGRVLTARAGAPIP